MRTSRTGCIDRVFHAKSRASVGSFVPKVLVVPKRSFQFGRRAERLFWRHAGSNGWLFSSLLHGAHLALDVPLSMIQPARLISLLGRSIGTLDVLFNRSSVIEPIPLTDSAVPPDKNLRRAA